MNKSCSGLQIALSLATFPLLIGLGTLQCFNKTVKDWGESSEELFRGDRLPLLSFRDER
ncbi:MAG: hypothetical protein ACRC6M_09705 [Microcystaceae cyanobacterium]